MMYRVTLTTVEECELETDLEDAEAYLEYLLRLAREDRGENERVTARLEVLIPDDPFGEMWATVSQ